MVMISSQGKQILNSFGAFNDIEFWQQFSGLSNGTATDYMVVALTKNGYSGTPQEMYRAWIKDIGGQPNLTLSDNILNIIGSSWRGLTFFKNYRTSGNGTVNANLSKGSGVATFTANRDSSAPATYVSSDGKINLVTSSNVPRINYGYYDLTGFHAGNYGLMVEGASTNLITYTDGTSSAGGLWTGWTYNAVVATGTNANNTDTSASNITLIPNSYWQTVSFSAGAGVSGVSQSAWIATPYSADNSVSAGDTVTVSFYYTCAVSGITVTPTIRWSLNDGTLVSTSTGTTLSGTSGISKYSYTFTAPATTQKVLFRIAISNIDTGDSVSLSLWGVQIEKTKYATSFIPTTTAALTRNAETCTYLLDKNLVEGTGTVFVKASFYGSSPNTALARLLCTDTSKWNILNNSGDSSFKYQLQPQGDTNGDVGITSDVTANTSCVIAYSFQETGNPNTVAYFNGASEASTDEDFNTAFSTDTKLYLADRAAGDRHNDVIFEKILIFDRVLSASEVAGIK